MTKHSKYIVFLFFLFVLTTTQAQVINQAPGVMFLEIQTDSRSAAMGGLSSVSESGVFRVFDNSSANLFSVKKFGVGATLSARKDFKDMNLFSLGTYYNLDEKNSISFGFRYFGYPNIDIADNTGANTEKFRPKEMALDLGYGRKLTDNLSLSMTLRYINSDLGSYLETKQGSAFAVGLGLTYVSSIEYLEGGKWILALAATNFGSKIRYDEEKYELPSALTAGTAVHLPISENHKLTGTLNLRYRALPSSFNTIETGIGAEYNLYNYGFLRAGYHFGDNEKGIGNFTTLGAGINIQPIRIDFAYLVGMSNEEFRHIAFISLSASF